MSRRTSWNDIPAPLSEEAQRAYEDQERINGFREFAYRLRTDAGLTQAELAARMGTTQSAIARIEGGGTRPSLRTLERMAQAVGQELVVGVGENLSANPSILRLALNGQAVLRGDVWPHKSAPRQRVGRRTN